MYRVFIVEDDAVIARAVSNELQKWGFEALVAENFADISGEVKAAAPQLVIMDISLPYYNGYYWCEKIRQASSVPIIFLSSRADTSDVVMAVSMGGDDYIFKPIDMELMIAKVQAVLRRAYDYEPQRDVQIGGVKFDAGASCLLAEGVRVELTKNESRILDILLKKRGRIVSREELMLKLWDSDEFVDDNTLTVNINRLRKTLNEAGAIDCIKTHKGQGYSIDA
jgi:DNA-binding response OmpR family regulator